MYVHTRLKKDFAHVQCNFHELVQIYFVLNLNVYQCFVIIHLVLVSIYNSILVTEMQRTSIMTEPRYNSQLSNTILKTGAGIMFLRLKIDYIMLKRQGHH